MEYFHLVPSLIIRKEEALEYIKEHIENNSHVNGTGKLNLFLRDGFSYEEWPENSKLYVYKEYAVSKTLFLVILFSLFVRVIIR